MFQSPLLLVCGLSVIAAVMMDVVWTTLTTKGSGPITRGISAAVMKCSRLVLSISGTRMALTPAGPIAIVLLGTIWLLLLWLGWVLLFSAFPAGIVNSQSGGPANLAERIYFVGFTLSTLGIGDFEPAGDASRLLTTIAAFNGLVLVTLIITYAVPLVQAVILRRKLAYTISLLGENPQDIVWTAWQEDNRQAFEESVVSITADVIQCSEQRLAYPMLDLFYSEGESFSLGLQVARLDEALSLLEFGMQPEHRFHSLSLTKARDVLSHYMQRVVLPPKDLRSAPPLPSIECLVRQRVPVMDNLAEAYQVLATRRIWLASAVLKEGWEWSRVEPGRPVIPS